MLHLAAKLFTDLSMMPRGLYVVGEVDGVEHARAVSRGRSVFGHRVGQAGVGGTIHTLRAV
jgi:hypothetical protein